METASMLLQGARLDPTGDGRRALLSIPGQIFGHKSSRDLCLTLPSIERLVDAQPGQVTRSETWVTHRSQEGDMTTSTLTIRATITKGHDGSDGYAVSVVLKENGIRRQLIDKVVPAASRRRPWLGPLRHRTTSLTQVELIYR